MLKVLICTNHMASIGGSEVVALEIAEFFKKNNYIVDIVANYIGYPMIELIKNSGINLLTTDDLPDPFNYDIVWSQHQVLPILINQYIDNFNDNTYFVFAHLSPYEHLETLGLYTERLLAHRIFANSKETFNNLCNLGLSIDISDILFNAAPREFFNNKTRNKEHLQNILLISNHPPEEILEALEILKFKYELNIINVGVRGSVERITPKFIKDADAVITIGKSVQYAIVGETPVYCYDHFGGIGWLSLDNYKKAEEYNYSGRCCLRRITAQEIVEEIIFGFKKAEEDIRNIKRETSNKYCLDNYMNYIIKASVENTISRHLQLEDKQKIKSESEIVKSIKQYYNAYNGLVIDHNQFLKRYNEISTEKNELSISTNQLISEKEDLLEKYNQLLSDKNELSISTNQLISEKENLLEKYNKLSMDNEGFLSKINELSSNTIILLDHHNQLLYDNNIILERYNKILSDRNILLEKFNELTTSNDELLVKYNMLTQDNEYLSVNNNILSANYTKLEKRFLKYKNTLLKRFARRIKRLYNKKE